MGSCFARGALRRDVRSGGVLQGEFGAGARGEVRVGYGFVMICTLPELSPERSLNGAPMTEMPVVDDAEYPN